MALSLITSSPAVFTEPAISIKTSIPSGVFVTGDIVKLYVDGVYANTMVADPSDASVFSVDVLLPAPNTDVNYTVRLQRGTLIGAPSAVFVASYQTLPVLTITGIEGTTS